MQLCSRVSILWHCLSLGFGMKTDLFSPVAVEVDQSFSSKEQASFNFMAAVTICSDFGGQKKKKNKVSYCFHRFPINLSWCDSIMSSANSAFYFFFNLDSFYIFSTLIATARASKIMLSKRGDNGHPWDFHIKWSQTKTNITHMWNIIFKNDTKELI